MRRYKTVSKDGPDEGEMYTLHLMALLHDLVRGHGRLEAARKLELDPRTVGKCMDGGRMSWRVREALERARRKGLLCGCSEESGREGAPLVQRVDALEQGIRAEVEKVRREVSAIGTGHSRTIRQIERRLDRMESPGNRSDTEAGPSPSEKSVTGAPERDPVSGEHVRGLPPYGRRRPEVIGQRRYPDLVTREPMEGDAVVYGPAWPLVHEWRGLWNVDPRDSDLSELESVERIRELEVAMLEEHGLTLPPETEPLRGLWRSYQLDWRRRALNHLRRARARRVLLRALRRILTLGLWHR